MLSPSAQWLAAARANSEPRMLLVITDNATPANTWKALSGYSSQIDAPVAIINAGQIGSEVDPLTHEQQTSEFAVEVADSWIRPILVNYRLKGQTAEIFYGFSDIIESDYLPVCAGPIDEITPDGTKDAGAVTLSVMDLLRVLQNIKICASWLNKHPLEIIYDGATGRSLLSRSGFNASTWCDESTFDPTDAEYASTIGHWCISRIMAFDVYKPSYVFEMMSGLCQLLSAQVIPDEEGILKLKRFNSADAAVDNWTVDDIVPGTFKSEPLDSNIINRVIVKFSGAEPGDLYPEMSVQFDDTTSQATYKYPGQTERILTHEIKTDWAPGCRVHLDDGSLTAGATTFSVWGDTFGLCGSRRFYPIGSQPASAALSASRPAYLLIDRASDPGHSTEIVKAEVMGAAAPSRSQNVHWFDWVSGWTDTDEWEGFAYATVTRGLFGTSDQTHFDDDVWDITAIVDMAQRILDRFKNGCPIIELCTPPIKMPVQQGDFVTLTLPGFLSYGIDGATTSQKWEVIGKEADLLGSPPQIKWRLALVSVASAPPTASVRGPKMRLGTLDQLERSQGAEETSQGFVGSGYTVTKTALLVGSIAAGTANSGLARAQRPTAVSHTFTASKDTYVLVNPFNSALSFAEVAIGAAAPAAAPHMVWIAKVRTDATEITTITDMRETKPYDGAKLQDLTVPGGAITPGAITSTKLGAEAVTPAAIATGAVAPVHVAAGSTPVYASGNANFVLRTRIM